MIGYFLTKSLVRHISTNCLVVSTNLLLECIIICIVVAWIQLSITQLVLANIIYDEYVYTTRLFNNGNTLSVRKER